MRTRNAKISGIRAQKSDGRADEEKEMKTYIFAMDVQHPGHLRRDWTADEERQRHRLLGDDY